MSFLTRLFKKKHEEDYETILAELASDVQKRQTLLSEIRLRERRSTLLVTLYTLAAWTAYVSLWYMNILPSFLDHRHGRSLAAEKAVKGIPVVIGPIVILFIRRVVQIWYKKKGDAEEKGLQNAMRLRREKVEEIKKKTNFNSTRELLQRYEDSPSSTPLRQRNTIQHQPSTPLKYPSNANPQLQTPAQPKALNAHLSPVSPPFPTEPPRKQWYDKLADAVLGDDEQPAGPPSSRYALICEKCFTHNGLVKESMWEDAQYVCPKCNHFNPSARSKRHTKTTPSPGGRQSLSPQRAMSTSPSLSPTGLPSVTNSQPSEQRVTPGLDPMVSEQRLDVPNVDDTDTVMMDVES